MARKTLITAQMARRAAGAADGIRNGEDVWFVVAYQFPHLLLKSPSGTWYYTTEDDAKTALNESRFPNQFAIVGPYNSPVEPIDQGNRVTTVRVTKFNKKTQTLDEDADLACW